MKRILLFLLLGFAHPVFSADGTTYNYGYFSSSSAAYAACSAGAGGSCFGSPYSNTQAFRSDWNNGTSPQVWCAGPDLDAGRCDKHVAYWYAGGGCDVGVDDGTGQCVEECAPGEEEINGVCQSISNECENAQFEGSVETIFGCQCPPGTYYKTVYDGSGSATQTCAPSQECNIQHPGYQGTLNGQAICDPASQCPPGYQGGMVSSNGITQLVCTPEIPDNSPNEYNNDLDGDGITDDQDPDIDGDGILNEDDDTPFGDEAQQGTEGSGVATDCTRPPTSTGDPQLAAIHLQMWKNHCENVMPDLAPAQDAIGAQIDAAGDSAIADMTAAFDGGLSALDGTDFGGSGSTDWLDIFPDIACSGFTMNWNDVTFSITCQDTKLLRDLLGFALAVFAIFSIFDIFTKSRKVV